MFFYIDLESVVSGVLEKETIINKTAAPSRAQRLLAENDVLFQMVRPYQKNNYLFTVEKSLPTVASTGYAQLRTFNNSYFLYQLINTQTFTDEVLVRCTGSSYPAINSNDMKEIGVSFPTISEQHKIADFLYKVDCRIETQQKLIESLKLYKRGLINNLFDRKIKTAGIWKKYSLSEILTERKTYCEKDGTYEHATLSKEGVYGKTERYDRDFLVSSDDKKYKITKYGDLCYNPANLKFGVICLNTHGDAIFSPIYVTFEIAPDFDKHFIAACVTRNDFINAALQFQQGTVYERMAVSPEDLLSMEIELPEVSIQKYYSSVFQKLNSLIESYEKQLDTMVVQKKTLLQQMFI